MITWVIIGVAFLIILFVMLLAVSVARVLAREDEAEELRYRRQVEEENARREQEAEADKD